MQKLMTNLLTLLQFNIFYEKDKTMSKNEMIEKLQKEIYWIDASIKRMERVWKSGAYRINVIEDICETLNNLKNTKRKLTEIVNALQLENSAQDKTDNTLTK